MKPLIVILLAAISLEAQTIAEAAKQERARQAALKSSKVFTDANSHVLTPMGGTPAPRPPAAAAAPAAAGTPAAQAAPAAATAPSALTLEEQAEKLRNKIHLLEDQETKLKLQINDASNQARAVVTDQPTLEQNQKKLGELQTRLATLQKELIQVRLDLRQIEVRISQKK